MKRAGRYEVWWRTNRTWSVDRVSDGVRARERFDRLAAAAVKMDIGVQIKLRRMTSARRGKILKRFSYSW